ncbi:MAG: hypothetical protein R3C49_08755 [Planctomycetaceae bacterium]
MSRSVDSSLDSRTYPGDHRDPMHDIRLAVALIAFVSIATYLLTFRLLRNRSNRVIELVAAVVVLLILVYLKYVWGQLWIVRWIPLPSVIVLSNWFPILLAPLAAACWIRLGRPIDLHRNSPHQHAPATVTTFLRRVPVMGTLVFGAAYSVLFFVPQEPPTCGEDWEQPFYPMRWPVCRQTTPHTCSAAASATMLLTLGIQSSEQEMATLCLTKSGTTWLGLYHGLSTKLQRTGYQVEFFSGGLSDLQQASAEHPVLLCCRLDHAEANQYPDYVVNGGWIPGMAHTVVYFGEYRGTHVVGDPSRGYEGWSTEALQILWTGDGLRITGAPFDDQENPADGA